MTDLELEVKRSALNVKADFIAELPEWIHAARKTKHAERDTIAKLV